MDSTEVIDCVPCKLSVTQNSELLKDITAEEVKTALFQMNLDKALGPDDTKSGFFQKYWSIVGNDFIWMTRHFFFTREIFKGLNDTNLVLILKKKHSTLVGELRLIALCNVLMKVITKVMVNRM